jgi:hypothetical protein
MTTRALAHSAPTISLTVTVNINADKTFLFIIGLIWWSVLRLTRIFDWIAAAGRVIWRRLRAWYRRQDSRLAWYFSGYCGPLVGVG